jgi:plasmid rolling circle replication initiator protein Rep
MSILLTPEEREACRRILVPMADAVKIQAALDRLAASDATWAEFGAVATNEIGHLRSLVDHLNAKLNDTHPHRCAACGDSIR